MQSELEEYYLNQPEPIKSCFLALREIILAFDPLIKDAWKYRMPFFVYKGKMFCYLWTDKKTGQPYVGVVQGKKIEHPRLVQGSRARMKVFYIDPLEDIPVEELYEVLSLNLAFYS